MKWIVDWQITRYGTKDEYDSFEEAKKAFRTKIAREIDIENYTLTDKQVESIFAPTSDAAQG